MIACGHCGGRHATVKEVRTCSLDAQPIDNGPTDIEPESAPPRLTEFSADRPKPPNGCRPVVLEPDWQRLAGPEHLGRNLVVNPGQDAPEPWAECERIAVDGQPGALGRLRELRKARTRAVIELRVDLGNEPPVLDVSYWHLSPNTELEGEALQHLVFRPLSRCPRTRAADDPSSLAGCQRRCQTTDPRPGRRRNQPRACMVRRRAARVVRRQRPRSAGDTGCSSRDRFGGIGSQRYAECRPRRRPASCGRTQRWRRQDHRSGRIGKDPGGSQNGPDTWYGTAGSIPQPSVSSPTTCAHAKKCRNAQQTWWAWKSALSTVWLWRSCADQVRSALPPAAMEPE